MMDYNVLAHSAVVGRILREHAGPGGRTPWIWTLTFGIRRNPLQFVRSAVEKS